jgi:hypothetical protein
MSSAKVVSMRIIAAWVISAAAILAVPLVVTDPATRSEYFFYRVIWTEVLSLIFWGSCIVVPLQLASARTRKAAIWGTAPIMIIMSGIYGFLSFILMVIASTIKNEGFARYHLGGQIVLGAVFLILVLLFSIIPACSSDNQADFDAKD